MNQNIKMIIKKINNNLENKTYVLSDNYEDIIEEFKYNMVIKNFSYFYNILLNFISKFKYIIILIIFLFLIMLKNT